MYSEVSVKEQFREPGNNCEHRKSFDLDKWKKGEGRGGACPCKSPVARDCYLI